MKKSLSACLILAILVITSIFIAGCSDNAGSGDSQSSDTAAAITTASTTALYTAGDIVKNPKSSSKAGLLILGYDAGTDTYERAYIYPNTDGSWGYRLDSKTEKISRSTVETLYTEKSGTIEVSSVPVGKPTTIATATATIATTAATTATTVATTTTSSAAAPKVSDIEPAAGKTGTTVSITALKGKYFVSGANVSLTKKGETSIVASGVSVSSAELITCKFAIPSDAGTGVWNVVVTNPDKQTYTWQNGFTITQGSSVATTTTTSSTVSAVGVKITSLLDSKFYIYNSPVRIGIFGTNLSSAANMQLTKDGSTAIIGSNYYIPSYGQAQADFTLPTGSAGTWTLSLIDSTGTVLNSKVDSITIASN